MPDLLKKHLVGIGESVVSIAAKFGHIWPTLWNLPENKLLRDLRGNPNVLQEGDEIWVPELRMKECGKSSDARHMFIRNGIPTLFRMRFLREGKPRRDVSYQCVIGDRTRSGTTSANGSISFPVPPNIKVGKLVLTDQGVVEKYDLRFGDLDPLSEIRGIQQRLRNLGYTCPDNGQLCNPTIDAINSFRRHYGLADKEHPVGDDLRKALKSKHKV